MSKFVSDFIYNCRDDDNYINNDITIMMIITNPSSNTFKVIKNILRTKKEVSTTFNMRLAFDIY